MHINIRLLAIIRRAFTACISPSPKAVNTMAYKGTKTKCADAT